MDQAKALQVRFERDLSKVREWSAKAAVTGTDDGRERQVALAAFRHGIDEGYRIGWTSAQLIAESAYKAGLEAAASGTALAGSAPDLAVAMGALANVLADRDRSLVEAVIAPRTKTVERDSLTGLILGVRDVPAN